MHGIPVRAAYAAAEAEVFPVDAQMSALAPRSSAFDSHRHTAVLERAGGVHPFVFHENFAVAADAFG